MGLVTHRSLQEHDLGLLEILLTLDPFHASTPLSFFLDKDSVCSVYEYDNIPILFVRGKALLLNGFKVIQLDIEFVNNNDVRRNMKTMLIGFPELARRAFDNGFHALIFESNVKPLRDFCLKRLDFEVLVGDFLIWMKHDEDCD